MKKLSDLNILVIGDIMLDHYLIGDVKRISPEAPVPIVDINKRSITLGGCGNVIKNLRSIGVNTFCISQIGLDKAGDLVQSELKKIGSKFCLIRGNHGFKTTVKTRLISTNNQQLLRYDQETKKSLELKESDKTFLKENIFDKLELFDCIILSDYAKGMISNEIIEYLKWKKLNIFLDPKPINHNKYSALEIFMVTPNQKECKELWDHIIRYEFCQYVLETLGDDGMRLYDKDDEYSYDESIEFKTKKVKVFNVSGAGDTVISIIATCKSMGYDLISSIKIANICANYVVQQPGTSCVPLGVFEKILAKFE